jgi:hypothetical protein
MHPDHQTIEFGRLLRARTLAIEGLFQVRSAPDHLQGQRMLEDALDLALQEIPRRAVGQLFLEICSLKTSG